jgi:hypothetical protein
MDRQRGARDTQSTGNYMSLTVLERIEMDLVISSGRRWDRRCGGVGKGGVKGQRQEGWMHADVRKLLEEQ